MTELEKTKSELDAVLRTKPRIDSQTVVIRIQKTEIVISEAVHRVSLPRCLKQQNAFYAACDMAQESLTKMEWKILDAQQVGDLKYIEEDNE